MLAERSKHGIPFDDGNWQQLCKLADRNGIRPPA
jgi:hypothetical protein